MLKLAFLKPLAHNFTIRGQSRGGGLVTSNGVRRSNVFGRVAVTHVQGPPKGGGALGAPRVTSTRLASVPPSNMEVGTRMTGNSEQSSGLSVVTRMRAQRSLRDVPQRAPR